MASGPDSDIRKQRSNSSRERFIDSHKTTWKGHESISYATRDSLKQSSLEIACKQETDSHHSELTSMSGHIVFFLSFHPTQGDTGTKTHAVTCNERE